MIIEVEGVKTKGNLIMRLCKSSYEILEQGPGLQGIYKQIELAGRTCYKSLDKITEDSAEGFVNRMIKSQHYAMLEHGTVYLKVTYKDVDYETLKNKYIYNKYSKCAVDMFDKIAFITSNLRVLVEMGWLSDLKYLCKPTINHEKRVSVKFTTSNSIMREFTRHRTMSFAVESTRYCNYSKDRLGKELTYIIPSWLNMNEVTPYLDDNGHIDWDRYNNDIIGFDTWNILSSWKKAEDAYMSLVNNGYSAQEAREVLPLATKCDMVMTGFVSDWQHFFDLRARGTTGAPHPDAKALAEPLMHEFENRNLI